jgi:membrane-bound lytic murein transglycosylase B
MRHTLLGVRHGETGTENSTEVGEPEVIESAYRPEVLSAQYAESSAWSRMTVMGGLIVAMAIGAVMAGAVVVPVIAAVPFAAKTVAPPATTIPEPTNSPTAEPTATPSAEPTAPPRPATAFTSWAAPLAGPLGIPQVALEAYGYAEWVLQQTRGTCKLQWTTLAAIGKVTTEHGKLNGSSLDAGGRQRPSLVGPALNGTGGNPRVTDTDAGALDGDQSWDHAVGPMQFTPAMWRVSGVDGDDDGLAEPQDIDDAALAAAYHLCSGTKDLSVAANWKAAVSAYHGLGPRIDKIFEEAQSYGVRSRS